MSDTAKTLLDMATLADVDGEKVRALKLREAAVFIEDLDVQIIKLERRVVNLEEGECRFHCRMRKDMWLAGMEVGFLWDGEGTYEEQYKKWREQHDK